MNSKLLAIVFILLLTNISVGLGHECVFGRINDVSKKFTLDVRGHSTKTFRIKDARLYLNCTIQDQNYIVCAIQADNSRQLHGSSVVVPIDSSYFAISSIVKQKVYYIKCKKN